MLNFIVQLLLFAISNRKKSYAYLLRNYKKVDLQFLMLPKFRMRKNWCFHKKTKANCAHM